MWKKQEENQILKMTKHQKHTNLVRRKHGTYAPNEVAILGAPCGTISDLVHRVSKKLSHYKLAYFDASHAVDVHPNRLSAFTFHHEGNLEISTTGPVNEYVQRIQFSPFDLVFINGNHYPGAAQIVFLDHEKEASITKRIHQLSEIHFFIQRTKGLAPFPSIQEAFPNWSSIPIYGIDEIEKITSHIAKLIKQQQAPLKGLVLTGGKSTRMGVDKSTLEYYGKPQKEVVHTMLKNQGLDTFFSVREGAGNANEIVDVFLNLGPFGGICSAFQKDPNAAWLVLATDLPFVNETIIAKLIARRNPAKVATAILGKGKPFPEPLIAIYEPKAYPILLQFLAQGYSCPRKMLINSDVELVEVDDEWIRNINTPEEFNAAKEEIDRKVT